MHDEHDELQYFFLDTTCLMESCSDAPNFRSAILFLKCQTFQIFSRQQTHSCVGISGFTDRVHPWLAQ